VVDRVTVPAEILKKVKLLEIRTRKVVNNVFAGEYHTNFKGQGMTFADFREYVPGDDVRSISWALTARAGKPYIKKYDEERELTVILAVDVSSSSDFGSGEYFKGEVMTYVAALLAFAAIKNKDQVGLLLFSDQVEHYVPPRKGRGHVQRILRDLFYIKPKSRRTKISVALQHLQGILKKKSTIFLISDFMDNEFDQQLRFLGKKHDVLGITIEDPKEMQLPNIGVVNIEDSETGETITVDTSSSHFRATYAAEMKRRRDQRENLLRKAQVDQVIVPTSGDFADPLIRYFQSRNRGRRR
jgi:uncharacterized protein (DUF58 family)